MSAEEGAAKEDKRGKRVKREQMKEEEEKPVVMLKDPYWVGQDVRGPYNGVKIRKEILNKGHKYVILYLDGFDYIAHRICLGCRLINGEFLGWNQTEDYPVTLRQVGHEAILSLHRNVDAVEIRLTIECPY